MKKQQKLEELKEKLKAKLGGDDRTLLLFALWYGLLSLDETPPERLTQDYIEGLRRKAEERGESIESLAARGLIELAKDYGLA
jgi:hypothetical protein